MARISTLAAITLAGLAAGGCVHDGPLSPHMNPSLNSVNQPVVQRNDYVFDLAGGGGVSQGELARLDAWFQSLALGYGDRISVDGGGQPADPATERAIAGVAESYGILLSDGAPVTSGQIAPGSVRVVVSRTTASVPGCPQWDPETIGGRISTTPNYGCATNSNLAAMIADPNDLVVGRTGDPSVDAATASKAIQSYRTKKPTGSGALKQEATGGSQQ